MESIIVNTVSNNANKGRRAIDWAVEAIGQESKVIILCQDTIIRVFKIIRPVWLGLRSQTIAKIAIYVSFSEYIWGVR